MRSSQADYKRQGRSWADACGDQRYPGVVAQIFFRLDEDKLDEDDQTELIGLADLYSIMFVGGQTVKLSVIGHADFRGDRAYNLDLARRRAESVARCLKRRFLGGPTRISPASIEIGVVSAGESPKPPHENPNQLDFDRRVEIKSSLIINECSRTRTRFTSEVWPLREDRVRFTKVLIERLSQFTIVHQRANQPPNQFDRTRLEAILSALGGRTSDEYLDLAEVNRLANIRYTSEDQAYRALTQQAVKRISVELERGHLHAHAGAFLPEFMTMNEYYSDLLRWDSWHCYGTLQEINRKTNLTQLGGGSIIGPVWTAAIRWIKEHERTGVYSFYFQGVTPDVR